MAREWETSIADLLNDLSSVQDELLEVLTAKRDCLRTANMEGLDELQAREQALIDRLQACHDRRGALLAEARKQGMAAESITGLATELSAEGRELARKASRVSGQTRLLQHQSLTNWVLTQRTLIHLSQLLEVIATGGRQRTTYGASPAAESSGALVDQAA